MNTHRHPVAAAMAVIMMTAALAACGNGSKSAPATTSSSATHSAASSSSAPAPSATSPSKLAPRNLQSESGTGNYTIADYIKDNHITETPVHQGDPGAPQVDVTFPDGWQSAGPDTPDYAYGALVYTGPEAQGANYTPNIIALLSKLDGPVDAQKLLSFAGGEMKNLPGFVPVGDETGTVSGFTAYRIAGSYDLEGIKAASGQESVVIPAPEGMYILQLNGTSNQDQSDALFTALGAIDKTLKITA